VSVTYNASMWKQGALVVICTLLVACGGEGDPNAAAAAHPAVADFKAFARVLTDELRDAFDEPFELYQSGNHLHWEYHITSDYKVEVHESTNLAAPFRATVRVQMTENAVGREPNPAVTVEHALTFEKLDDRWVLLSAFEKVQRRNHNVDLLHTHGYDEVKVRIQQAIDAAHEARRESGDTTSANG